MYRVELLLSARKSLTKLAPALQRRIGRRIDQLAADPRPPGARKLVGADDVWRVRIGDYRVLYTVADDVLVVLVIEIGHRRDIYR